MRVLIVGAGVAGLTLAALLRQQGREAEVVERQPAFAPNGYALMIYPLGGGVLHGLGLYDALRARAMAFDTFSLADGHGRAVEDYDLREITETIGPMVSVRRPDLLWLLHDAAGGPDALRLGTTIADLAPGPSGVDVTFSDGATGRYDVVVASDGMHSRTRRLLFGQDPAARVTDHAMYVWWGPEGLCEPGRVIEWWGRGRVAALCPVPGAVQCSVVLPAAPGDDAHASSETLRPLVCAALEGLGGATLDGMRAAAASATEIYRWPLYDVRTSEWTTAGRVALLGDAAVGFLPTAGIGASSAMRTAAILADELSRVDGAHVPHALDLYVRRARRLAELHQDESRRFGRAMLMDSPVGVPLRDLLLRHVSASHLLGRLLASMREPA